MDRHHLFFSVVAVVVHRLIAVVEVGIYWYQLLGLVVDQQVLFEFMGLQLIWKTDVFDLDLLDVLHGIIINDYLVEDFELKVFLYSSWSITVARTWSKMRIVVDFIIRQDEDDLL